ncbi:ABC transporter substrate-binding protein [Streptomyces sp. NPDC057702]|uniref:ABC transporter substrate-binding protein n=1 Tax=unclassified Streptomyces TaxID=2593676 RepID=UPI0036C1CFD1
MNATRRRLLWAGGALGTTTLLGACGGNGGGAPTGPHDGEKPRRGGTLRVGALGRTAAITRDPHGVQANESDYLVIALVYDTLTAPGGKTNTVPRLASSWTSSRDLRTWRFTVADGAAFHDGSPVTAADLVWSLRRLRGTPSGASRMPGVAARNIRPYGERGVELVSDYPNAELPQLMRLSTFVLKRDTPDGEIHRSPGTGPFRLDWYRGGNARLVRNDAWHGGEVLLDAIEVRLFESPQAMSNALLAGQLDLASNVGAVAARTAERRADVQVVRRRDDMPLPIVMRTADGPYADPRVREALRLAVDREAMVRQALSGYGVVGNDVMGTGDPAYDRSLPQRVRDLDRSRKLLAEADFDLARTYELVTTEDVPALAESATLFAGQVREAGVRVKVVTRESAVFYDQTWLKGDLYTTYWGTNDSVVFFASKTLSSDAAQNEAGWRDPAFDAAYHKAMRTADARARVAPLRELQRIQHERSGYLLWGVADGIDLAAAPVRGLPKLPGYGRVQLERAWLAR